MELNTATNSDGKLSARFKLTTIIEIKQIMQMEIVCAFLHAKQSPSIADSHKHTISATNQKDRIYIESSSLTDSFQLIFPTHYMS